MQWKRIYPKETIIKARNKYFVQVTFSNTFIVDNSVPNKIEDTIKIVNMLVKINVFQNDGLFVLSIFELGNFSLFWL